MRRVACALSAPTACYGFCCRDSGRVGADVCRWCNPPRSSLGTGELSPCIGHGSHVPAGKTENDCGDSRLDSAHEPRQPVVGSPPRSRGTPKVGNRGGAIDGGQVSATAPEAAHADKANILDQSCGLDRLLYRFDRNIPGSVLLRPAFPCSTPGGSLRCDGAPEPGVDNAANSRS